MGTRKTILTLLLSVIITAPVAGRTRRPTEPRITVPPIPASRPTAAAPQTSPQSADVSGALGGATYTNSHFGFTLTLPEGWQAQGPEALQQIAQVSQKVTEQLIRNRTPEEQRDIRRSRARATRLLVAVKPTGAAFSPSFSVLAENIAGATNVRTPRQSIEAMRELNNRINALMSYEDEITAERVGGVEFAVVKARPRIPPQNAPNAELLIYCTVRRDYALAFALSYNSPEELKDCLDALRAVEFN